MAISDLLSLLGIQSAGNHDLVPNIPQMSGDPSYAGPKPGMDLMFNSMNPPGQSPDSGQGNDIVVNGQQSASSQQAPAQAQDPSAPAPQPFDYQEQKHHGVFGVHGALRDILGTLGDAFLVQGGRAPVYGPARDAERISDIMTAMGTDPTSQQYLRGIPALAEIDPQYARGIYQDALKTRYEDATTQTRSGNLKLKQNSYNTAAVASGLSDLDPEDDDVNDQYLERKQTLKDAGFDVSGLPDEYDENAIDAIVNSDPKTAKRMQDKIIQQGRMSNYADRTKAYVAGQKATIPVKQAQARKINADADAVPTNTQSRQIQAQAAKTRADKYQPGGRGRAPITLPGQSAPGAKPPINGGKPFMQGGHTFVDHGDGRGPQPIK